MYLRRKLESGLLLYRFERWWFTRDRLNFQLELNYNDLLKRDYIIDNYNIEKL